MQSDDSSASRGTSVDRLVTLQSGLARRIHHLNNLLTAFHCLWDSEVIESRRAGGLSSFSNDLTDVVEQIQTELRTFLRDSKSLVSHAVEREESPSSAGETTTVQHGEGRPAQPDRASDRGPHSPES